MTSIAIFSSWIETLIQSTPQFRTLGAAITKTCKIHIAGSERLVGGNCLHALRQARHFLEEGSLVWIDAICINQSDPEEKGLQVNLMGDTYRKAERVLACIGQVGTHEDKELIGLLSRQGDEFEKLWSSTQGAEKCEVYLRARSNSKGFQQDLCHPTHLWIATVNNDQFYSLFDAVEILSTSPYWRRF